LIIVTLLIHCLLIQSYMKNTYYKFPARKLTAFCLIISVLSFLSFEGKAQGKVLINEYLSWPSNGCNVTSEYVELYNFGPGPMNIGGYILTDGDYSITIPQGSIILPGQFFVIAGQSNLPIGCANISSAVTVNLNWNACNCTSAAIPTTGDGLMTDGGSGSEQVVLFDSNLKVVDAVVRTITESSSPVTTSTVGGTYTSKTFNLDTMNIVYEQIGESQGRGNSFARFINGGCGWVKDPQQSAGGPNNTPGDALYNANLTVTNTTTCTNTGSVTFSITGSNINQLFPMKYIMARDVDSNDIYDFSDAYVSGGDTIPTAVTIDNLVPGRYRIVIETVNGCDLKMFDFVILNCNNVILPVDFKLFTLTRIQQGIYLQWTTAGNEPIQKFEIEKSNDGLQFRTAGSINNMVNNTTSFSFLDSTSDQAIFYRIKLITNSGRIIYSKIESVHQSSLNSLLKGVYPNPVKDMVIVRTQSASKCKGWVEIRSMYNGPIRRFDIDIAPGKMEHSLSLGFLPTGIYLLRVFTEDGSPSGTTRLVKL